MAGLWKLRFPFSPRKQPAGVRLIASDADWAVYQHLAGQWEAPGPETRVALAEIPTDGGPDEALGRALSGLRAWNL